VVWGLTDDAEVQRSSGEVVPSTVVGMGLLVGYRFYLEVVPAGA
jgi:hypothetical protein